MSDWKQVETPKDIEDLLQDFYGFHDSCITSIRYESGNYVTKNGTMVFATVNDYELHMTLQSQWEHKTVELCFSGVRQLLFLVGLEDNYGNDVYGAYLAFHDDLLPSKHRAPKRMIVWADDPDFDVADISSELTEPSVTYIIASALKWRSLNPQP